MTSQVVNLEQKRSDRRKKFADTVAILKDDPHDVRARLQVIELLQEEGRVDEAVEEILRTAANYTRRGVPIKAIAVMRTAVKLRPERADVRMAYGEVFEKLRMVDDAAREFRVAWDLQLAQGQIQGALDALGHLLGLDPAFVPGHVVFAEALGRAGRHDQAAAAFRRLADHLLSTGAIEDWEKVAERAVFFDPKDITLAHDLALHYVRTSRHAAALSKLIVCYEAEPGDGELTELIVEVLDALGQRERAASLLRVQVARYRRDGLTTEAERTTLYLHELDPDDPDARAAVGANAGAMANDSILELQADADAFRAPALPRTRRPASDSDEFGFGDGAPPISATTNAPPPIPATTNAPPPIPTNDDEMPPLPDFEGPAPARRANSGVSRVESSGPASDLDALPFDSLDGRPTMRGAAAFESQGFPADGAPAMVEAPPPLERSAKRDDFARTAPERPSLRRTISRPTLSRMTTASRPGAPTTNADELDATSPLAARAAMVPQLPMRGAPSLAPVLGVEVDEDEEAGFGAHESEATTIDSSVLDALRTLGEAPSSAARGFDSGIFGDSGAFDPDGDRLSCPVLNARRRSNNLPRPKLVRAGPVAADGNLRSISNDLKTLDFFIERGFYESAVALSAELEKRHPTSEELRLRRAKIAAMTRRS